MNNFIQSFTIMNNFIKTGYCKMHSSESLRYSNLLWNPQPPTLHSKRSVPTFWLGHPVLTWNSRTDKGRADPLEHNFTEWPSDVSDMAHNADLLSTKVNAHVRMSCSTLYSGHLGASARAQSQYTDCIEEGEELCASNIKSANGNYNTGIKLSQMNNAF